MPATCNASHNPARPPRPGNRLSGQPSAQRTADPQANIETSRAAAAAVPRLPYATPIDIQQYPGVGDATAQSPASRRRSSVPQTIRPVRQPVRAIRRPSDDRHYTGCRSRLYLRQGASRIGVIGQAEMSGSQHITTLLCEAGPVPVRRHRSLGLPLASIAMLHIVEFRRLTAVDGGCVTAADSFDNRAACRNQLSSDIAGTGTRRDEHALLPRRSIGISSRPSRHCCGADRNDRCRRSGSLAVRRRYQRNLSLDIHQQILLSISRPVKSDDAGRNHGSVRAVASGAQHLRWRDYWSGLRGISERNRRPRRQRRSVQPAKERRLARPAAPTAATRRPRSRQPAAGRRLRAFRCSAAPSSGSNFRRQWCAINATLFGECVVEPRLVSASSTGASGWRRTVSTFVTAATSRSAQAQREPRAVTPLWERSPASPARA